jgi:molybdopterin synthase catalytic subunit
MTALPASRATPATEGTTGIFTSTITVTDLENTVSDPRAGATVSFAGTVRAYDHGREVTALTYEGHPSAGAVLATIVAEAEDQPGVVQATAAHRVGTLEVGELAFAVAVSSAHRGEAFAACAWLVDEVKSRLPVWKQQLFADGTTEWVNCA